MPQTDTQNDGDIWDRRIRLEVTDKPLEAEEIYEAVHMFHNGSYGVVYVSGEII